MFSSSNKSQDSFLELFQSAAQARSSLSGIDSPKKESLKNILTAKSPLLSPSSNSDNPSAALKNFLLNGNGAENSGSSEAFQIAEESEILVQFKKATLEGKNFPGGMLASSGNFLAYLVNERKVRIFNTETGQKCSIDRANGVIVGLSWSDDLGQPGETFLAVLAEDGEITIGRISAYEADEDENELSFEVTSILSFPEIGRARAISWNHGSEIGGKKHLAVHGNVSSDVFFVHCSSTISGKSSFVNTSIQDIKNVSLTESGACWVSGRDGMIEKFQYSGSSYQPSFSLKLPVKILDSVKIIDVLDSTYCLALSEGVLSVFLLNNFDDEPSKVCSLELKIPANELVFEPATKTLLLFSHGRREIEVISLAKINSPRSIHQNLNPKSAIILDAIFNIKKCSQSGEKINFGVLFYFSDSICCQEGSYELELDESDYDESTQEEAEESGNELGQQIGEVSPFNIPQEHISQHVSSFNDMSDFKAEIKLLVRETIKETLIEVIHEALNTSVRAGFNQISEDLMKLTQTLIKSVESDAEMTSPDIPMSHRHSEVGDDTQSIRHLIAQGQYGKALKKAASSGNSRLLLEICQKFEDPFTALDEEQLSQETLAQMVSLLGLDIDEDTEVKLDWLQEILIQTDFDSDIIENQKLSQLIDNLFDELKSLVNDSLVDGNLQKKMKTVMRLLRKFQMN